MKIGDLVKFKNYSNSNPISNYRKKGLIVSFDEDNDPIVMWFNTYFGGQPEANFRSHLVVISES